MALFLTLAGLFLVFLALFLYYRFRKDLTTRSALKEMIWDIVSSFPPR